MSQLSNPYHPLQTLTADGDLLIRSGGAITRLGIGTTNQLLGVTGGVPAWQSGLLDASGNQLYVRRSGADTMTGFWNIGANKLGINTTNTTSNLNIAVASTTTPGITFMLGSGATERIWQAAQSPAGAWYGWSQEIDETNGDMYVTAHNGSAAGTQMLRHYRATGRLHIGSAAALSPITNELLQVAGLTKTTKGLDVNAAGGNDGTGNALRVWGNSGDAGISLLRTIPAAFTNVGAVAINTNSVLGGLTMAGLSNGTPAFWLETPGISDARTLYFGPSSQYGFGFKNEEVSYGDFYGYRRNGAASDTITYVTRRDNGNFGFGSIWTTSTRPTAKIHIEAGTATASTAPLKFTSGTLLSSAEAGAVEFLTDKWYATITTGTARKELTLNDAALTSGRVPIVTTNGRLTDDADMTFATDTLTVTKGDIGFPYLHQQDSTTQEITTSGTAQVLTFDTNTYASGITRTSSSRFTIPTAGAYLITFSGIADLKGGANKHIEVWLRVNGSDVTASNTRVEIPAPNIEMTVAFSFVYVFTANQYFELWTTGDVSAGANGIQWQATAAGGTSANVACPSLIMTCNKISK